MAGVLRSWRWYIYERDGFRKPNQFGYSPDGYRLRIISAARSGYPPGLEGTTPCFPGNLAPNDIPFPMVFSSVTIAITPCWVDNHLLARPTTTLPL